MPTWKNGVPNGTVTEREAAEQLDDAEERDDQRADVERAPGRRQPQRERDHELAERAASCFHHGSAGEGILALAAREEVVGVAGVVREQPAEVVAREVARVDVEPRRRGRSGPEAVGGMCRVRLRCRSAAAHRRRFDGSGRIAGSIDGRRVGRSSSRSSSVSSLKMTCRMAAVGTARMAPTMPSSLPPMSSATITVTALTPTCRAMTFGTSTWFSNCCCTTKNTMTSSTFLSETLEATAIAGIAERIGPTTGISSPTPEISAST